MKKTNYHTQRNTSDVPKRETVKTAKSSKSSVPVDKGLNNFFRGTRYLENKGEKADGDAQ